MKSNGVERTDRERELDGVMCKNRGKPNTPGIIHPNNYEYQLAKNWKIKFYSFFKKNYEKILI